MKKLKKMIKIKSLMRTAKFAFIILIFIALFSFIAIKTANTMGNNPKEEEYALITQDLKQTNQEYINALPSLKVEKLAELAAKSANRKGKLLMDLKTDPELFLKNGKLANERDGFPEEVREDIEENIETEGVFRVITTDEKNKPSKKAYMLEASNGNFMIKTWANLDVKPNSIIKIKGVKLENYIALSPNLNEETGIEISSLPGEINVTNAKVAVILFKFTNTSSEPFTKTAVDNAFTNASNSVRNYYLENSMNQMTFSSTTFGWYQINYSNASGCDNFGVWTDAVDQLMANRGINLTGYNYKYYIFPQTEGCWSSAWAEQSGSRSWSNGDIDPKTLGHELGHNFGASHANHYDCGSRTIDVASNCTSVEYGDVFDLMGNYWWMTNSVHFNASHKASVGWIPTSKIRNITSDGTYTVNSLETTQTSPQALKIRKNDTNEFYYVSKRQNIGFDQEIPVSITNGASLHLWNDNNFSPTQLLDTSPGSNSDNWYDFYDASLMDGQEFYDQINKITIKQISHTSTSVTVQVKFTNPVTPTPTNTPTPTPSISPTPTPILGVQLIKNPGFEKDTDSNNKPDNWTLNSNFTRSSSSVHLGKFSGRHKSANNVSYNVSQKILNIKAGKKYAFSGWTKILSTTDKNFNFIITIKWRNAKNDIISTTTVKNYSASTSGWDNATRNITAPRGSTNALIIMQVKSLNATVFVDDFSLRSL